VFRECKKCEKNFLTFLAKHEDHEGNRESEELIRAESYGSEGESPPTELKQILKK
jgi:hypothetical protein